MSKFIDRTGEVNIAKNGQKMTVIACRLSNDIDVQFEDGTIVKNKTWQCFKVGSIGHPNINSLTKIKRIGETNIAKNGQKMTIIAYRNSSDIDVKFEDDTVVTNKSYDSFKNSKIENPNKKFITYTKVRGNNRAKNNAEKRIGEFNIASNGQKMTIIAYRKNNDIDVQFEDGTIVYNKSYSYFKKGTIRNPNKRKLSRKSKSKRIGETSISKMGQKLTIINYRNCDDIDVQFEDGTIVYNKKYEKFKSGSIENPNKPTINGNLNKNRKKWLNNSKLNKNNGLYMTISDYISSNNILVSFETGYNLNIYLQYYKLGKIKHPFPYQMNNITVEKLAYIHKETGIGNFYCKCLKCGYRDIWTIENAKNHKCEEIKK